RTWPRRRRLSCSRLPALGFGAEALVMFDRQLRGISAHFGGPPAAFVAAGVLGVMVFPADRQTPLVIALRSLAGIDPAGGEVGEPDVRGVRSALAGVLHDGADAAGL